MSHFYARIPNSARATVPTARGHKSTGLTVQAASWRGCVEIDIWHNAETGHDEFRVSQVLWHGNGIREEIAAGRLGAVTEPMAFADNL